MSSSQSTLSLTTLFCVSVFLCSAACNTTTTRLPSSAETPTSSSTTASSGSKAALAPGLDPELTSFVYPFPVQFFQVESQRQKLQMAYMDVPSEKPNGQTVVLLHGKNFSAAYWASTIRFLNSAGFRVIAPDQIGFGKSSKPETYQFSFQSLASNTQRLLESLKIQKFHLVGHSMGGMLATRMSLMYPLVVQKLILVNPIGLEDWKTVVPYRTIEQHYEQEMRSNRESIKEYQKQNYFAGQWKPEYDSLIEILAGWTEHPDYHKVAWNSALTADMIFTQPVFYEFEKIKAPTLLVIGQRDRTAIGKAWAPPEAAKNLGNYPSLGKAAAKRIPKSKLVEIPEAGHLPQVESFEKYSQALLSFLR